MERGQNAVSRAEARIRAQGNIIELKEKKKLVVMSDLHRGIGNGSDNFARNQMIFLSALQHYYREGYSYLELGDGDDLWENKRMDAIIREYSEIFRLLGAFYKKGRFYMVYGNHDHIKKSKEKIHTSWCHMRDSCLGHYSPLFTDFTAQEGYIIRQSGSEREFLALHGHQGDFWNDTLAPVSAFLVRYVWEPLEKIGIKNPGEGSIYQRARNHQEKRLMKWADKRERELVAGHTHQPCFPCEKAQYYYNCGCGVKNGYITALEFDKDRVVLVKWQVEPDACGVLKVTREVLRDELEEYQCKKGK